MKKILNIKIIVLAYLLFILSLIVFSCGPVSTTRDSDKTHTPPPGIGGLRSPRNLTEEEKTRVEEIAVTSPEIMQWLDGRKDFLILPVYWTEVIWTNEKPLYINMHIEDTPKNSPDIDPNTYWYPATNVRVDSDGWGERMVAVDLDAGKVAFVRPLPYSPPPSSVSSDISN